MEMGIKHIVFGRKIKTQAGKRGSLAGKLALGPEKDSLGP